MTVWWRVMRQSYGRRLEIAGSGLATIVVLVTPLLSMGLAASLERFHHLAHGPRSNTGVRGKDE